MHQFRGNAFLTADQPWSGLIRITPPLGSKHIGDSCNRVGDSLSGFGSGFLVNGGSYITLVPLRHESHMNAEDIAFVMIIETLYGSCGEHPVAGDVA